jgi:hypothetical protein
MAGTMRSVVAGSLLVLAVSATGCSGGSSHRRVAAPPTTAAPAIRLAVSGADVAATRGPAPAFPAAVQTGVMGTLDKWVEGGVVTALRSGVAGDIGGLFTADVTPRLTGPDRVALVDEGLPRANAIRPAAQTVALTALTGADGSVELVTARVDLRLDVAAPDGPYTVAHSGELVLAPDAGGWRIAGYDLRAVRQDTSGTTTTTTATTAPVPRP